MSTFDLKSSTEAINQSAKKLESDISYVSITDAFRFLRNSCGTNPESQNEIIRYTGILSNTKQILKNIISNDSASEEKIICLQVGMQFLANLLVNNKNNQEIVWLNCQDLLNLCLKFNDVKVQNCCAMILYNIFLGKPEFLDRLNDPLEDLIELTAKDISEFALFMLELFVLKSNYVENYYEKLKPENRLIVLEVIQNLITEQHNPNIKFEVIKYFTNYFTKNSDCILKTTAKYAEALDPTEIIKVLELLVAFSSDDQQNYLQNIQKETSLLINCIMLLRSIHMISKESGNEFSMLTKISEYKELEEKNISVQEHPFFGFKCSLIRLIGNLCWKNSANQDMVRELDCIPVLLDCCNIDARNPFIIQWCILAIRNICEKNHENQKVIASMSKEGKVDSARLQEIGIMLNAGNKGDSLFIAPLNVEK